MQEFRPIRGTTVLLILLLSFAAGPNQQAAAGASGFADTVGGRGGEIIRVTTLAPEGKGSLQSALRTPGRRIIVFEVGGIIDLAGRTLRISEPYVTLAGQTAPAPGITLIRGGLTIATHDVIVKHLRVRPGEAGREKKSGWEADGIATINASNVIIDHCSCTWATDENLSASGDRHRGSTVAEWREGTSHGITFSNCIIAEGLSKSTHEKGEHSKGSLLHDNTTFIKVVGNLYASNMERNPLAKGGVHAVIVNNWISNPGRRGIHHALAENEWGKRPHVESRLSLVANVLEYGADTPAKMPLFYNHGTGPVSLHMADNLAFDLARNPAPLIGGGPVTTGGEKPPWPDELEVLPATQVKERIARMAGARPWDRDPIDKRIVDAALDGTGKIIDSEQEVGGYPPPTETRAPFKAGDWNLDTLEPINSR